MVVSEGIKVAKDGELILSNYVRGSGITGAPAYDAEAHVAQFVLFYLSMMSFLSTTYVVQEKRKTGNGPVSLPRGQRRATVESNISVAILRRPEKVAKQIQQRVREQMERDGKKWALDHEVSVSGHWRNQYYRSTKTHARIWISDHRRGPEGIEASPKPAKQKVIKAVR
jgi:predicted P-loop ATPase